jgi:hypothetical protein
MAALAGLVGGVILIQIASTVEDYLRPRRLSHPYGLLLLIALSAGAVAGLYERKPAGWEYLVLPISAFGIFTTCLFVVNLSQVVLAALVNRKIAGHFAHADLSDSILVALNTISEEEPADYRKVASLLYISAESFERNWRQLLADGDLPPSMGPRLNRIAQRIAAGMRQLGMEVNFPATKFGHRKELRGER